MESQQGQASPSTWKDPRRKILAAILAAAIVCAALFGYGLYSYLSGSDAGDSSAIAAGDLVTMNYIGRTPEGRVFDTSIYSVASNDAMYPKSLTFSLRENTTYVPFNMTAGNYGSGGTIKGFALGVIGLHTGDHVTIEIAQGEGYEIVPQLTLWQNLEEDVPLVEIMTTEDFTDNFLTTPVPMAILPHYFWGWDVQVVEILAGVVTVKNLPTVGGTVYPFGNPDDPLDPSGWPVEVLSCDLVNQKITVKHHLSASDVYSIKGTDIDGKTLIVTGFNGDNGTFQVGKSDPSSGYNAEIAGRTLFFEITIIKVTPAEGE